MTQEEKKDAAYIKIMSRLQCLVYEREEIDRMQDMSKDTINLMIASNRREEQVYEYILKLIELDK